MQTAAPPGDVLLTEATFKEIRDYVRCTQLGGINVKGIKETITAYQPEEITVDLGQVRAAGGSERARSRPGPWSA